MFYFRCALVLFLTLSFENVDLLENGLARTPPMGWMSWGYYMCSHKCEKEDSKCLDEKLILSVADAFYNEGYQEAGYEYIIIDDCWSEKKRDEQGRLVADKKRFPRGMKYIADYIHARGLKFGMYTNIGKDTCMRYPGSLDYMSQDAKSFAEWGVDYLKVDGCFIGEDILNTGYIKLGQHLNKTGRPMVYSCSWPYYIQYIHQKQPDYSLVSQYCNVWRTYHDVQTSWEVVMQIIRHYIHQYPVLAPHHRPGSWNDPDMLMLGNGILNHGQSRVQMAAFAMMAAPLLISCDMKRITPYEKKLLQNLDLLAIAQDPMGIMGRPHMRHSLAVWVKPHLPKKGDWWPSYSIALLNLDIEDIQLPLHLKWYGLNCTDGYSVLDVFSGKFVQNVSIFDIMHVPVPGMDAVLYTLFPL